MQSSPAWSTRVRHAPDRYTAASFSSQHSRSSTSNGKQKASQTAEIKQSKLAKDLEDCEQEEQFVANYSYTHVGQALTQENPYPYVDVPELVPRLPRRSPGITESKTLDVEVSLEEKRDDRAVSVALEAVVEETSLISSSQDKSEPDPTVEEQPEYDPLPTQDEPVIIDVQTTSSPLEEALRSGHEGRPGQAAAQVHPIKAEPDAGGSIVSSRASSALVFVDTVQDDERDDSTRIEEPTRLTAPSVARYHPETRLSHGKDEVESFSKSVTRPSQPITKQKKTTEIDIPSLFMGGSDDEDASQNRQSKSQVSKSPAETSQKKKRISTEKTTVSKNVQETNEAAASEKAKEKEKVAHVVQSGPWKSKDNQARDKQKNEDVSESSSLEGRKKRKRKLQSSMDQVERKKSKREAKEDDLAQDLNIDAMAHPTSTRMQIAKRSAGLKKLQREKRRAERRRQGQITSSESSSDSDSDNSSESIDEDDFIVEDDDEPSRAGDKKGKKPVARLRRSVSPPSLISRDHLSNVRSYPHRQRLEEYIRWVATYALDVELTRERKNQLEAVRTLLKEKFKMDFKSLISMSNRRQFTWYLKHYPYFERRNMTREENEKRRGCASCHKTTKKCEHAFTVWGNWYNIDTLEKKTNSDYSSSALSTNAEDLKIKSKNEKDEKTFTFYLGSNCASFATIKHRLYHWERRVLNDITKLPNYKTLRRQGEVEEDEIDVLVDTYYPKLSLRYNQLENEARNLLVQPTAPRKLREKWDDDP